MPSEIEFPSPFPELDGKAVSSATPAAPSSPRPGDVWLDTDDDAGQTVDSSAYTELAARVDGTAARAAALSLILGG